MSVKIEGETITDTSLEASAYKEITSVRSFGDRIELMGDDSVIASLIFEVRRLRAELEKAEQGRVEAAQEITDLKKHENENITASMDCENYRGQIDMFQVRLKDAKAKIEELKKLNAVIQAAAEDLYTLVDSLGKENAELKAQIFKEICICAAVKTPSGIYRGHRHGDCFALMQKKKIERTPEDVQGFITSRNRFVDRNEGRTLQEAAGIPSIDPAGYTFKTLFSEDLY
jgi:hypothetical protein